MGTFKSIEFWIIILLILIVPAIIINTVSNRKQCEELGGIFYSGGFSADNCVFPPQNN